MSDPTTRARTVTAPRAGRDNAAKLHEATTDIRPEAGQGSVVPEAADEGDPEVALVKRAADVLGVEQMVRWMKMRIPSLDHQTPLSLMETETGRQEVERVLTQIEHGIF